MTIAPIIRHVTSRPNVCERTIKTILLACLQAQQLQRNHRRARPRLNCKPPPAPGCILTAFDCSVRRRGTFDTIHRFCRALQLHSKRSTIPRAPSAPGWRRWRRSPLFELLLRACLWSGNTRDTCARCARNTCDLLPTVYLLLPAPTDDGEYTYMCISYYARKDPLSHSEQTKFPQIKFIPV